MPCPQCGQSVEPGSRFCPHCGALISARAADTPGDSGPAYAPPYAGTPGSQHTVQPPYSPVRPQLRRPRSGRMVAGVCAGFANAYGWNVVLIRILLVVLTPLHLGLGFLGYVIGWIVIPEDPRGTGAVPSQGRP